MADYDAIVIGSGSGGMAAALGLARAGKSVMIFEQHYLPGGWTHSFKLDGYLYSPGVHYIGDLGPGRRIRTLYEGIGVANDLPFMELNPDGIDHVQIGEHRFDIPKGKEALISRLTAQFPKEAAGIESYVNKMDAIAYQLEHGPAGKGPLGKFGIPWDMRTVISQGGYSLQTILDRHFSDPLLKAILSIQAGDHGLGPAKVPFVMHAAIQGHYLNGGYYPKGGGRSIPKAFLKQIKARGGKITMRTSVSQVLVRNNKAVGVRLADGTEVSSDVVVTNTDPGVTWNKLIAPEHVSPKVRTRVDNLRWSITGLSLFFAVKGDYRARGFDSGNYWFARDENLDTAYNFSQRTDLSDIPEFPGVFLTFTTLKDPTKRTDGIHTCEAFIFIDPRTFKQWEASNYGERPAQYDTFKARLTDRMFEAIERIAPGIRDDTIFHNLGTPLTTNHYMGATNGNFYGSEKTLGNLGPMGFPIRTHIENFYQCGASTVGHGVAGAANTGVIAAQLATKSTRDELLNATGQTLRTYLADDDSDWPEEWKQRAAQSDRKRQVSGQAVHPV